MADNGYKTVTRIIEYHGPVEWLEKTLAQSRIPIQGALNLSNHVYIKSGVIVWQPDAITEAQVDASQQPDHQPDQPAVKTVPFKKPGE